MTKVIQKEGLTWKKCHRELRESRLVLKGQSCKAVLSKDSGIRFALVQNIITLHFQGSEFPCL